MRRDDISSIYSCAQTMSSIRRAARRQPFKNRCCKVLVRRKACGCCTFRCILSPAQRSCTAFSSGGPVELPAGSETAKTEATCLPVAPPPGGRTSSVSVALATIAAIFVIYKLVQSSPQTSPWAQSYDPTGHWWFSTMRSSARSRFAWLAGFLAYQGALRRVTWFGHHPYLRHLDFSHAGSSGGQDNLVGSRIWIASYRLDCSQYPLSVPAHL